MSQEEKSEVSTFDCSNDYDIPPLMDNGKTENSWNYIPTQGKDSPGLNQLPLNQVKEMISNTEKRIIEEIQELRKEIITFSNPICANKQSGLNDEDQTKRTEEDESKITFRVKLCRATDCTYLEKKTCNNMKYHYVLYHKDLEYPSKPFDEAEMNYNEYKKLKDLWMDSEQRHTTLALRRNRDLSSASKKRKYDGSFCAN